ncbi:hydroxyisourate hydrolase [Microtetraspora fusca]|uniref:5-hydroxyisourate hydrolase n=1 Tax=Microtetraspora fusca TaxID=1997 RepID=A0ABW6UYX1_MICFU|nr:hydroxyisourate hydrolase [Microtetraspora fusca]
MSLSTHVLDTAKGVPAPGVLVRLSRMTVHGFLAAAEGRTDGDGRIREWSPVSAEWVEGTDPRPGTYRLVFHTGEYLGEDAFFPEVSVVFTIREHDGHCHVPLLLSPYAYSTYRGS